ncbi:hypothetical protein EMCRGX_G010136 [Ephydatia muelleri]|eukprot:Em0003g1439a
MKTAILITVLVTLVIASELVVEAEWKQWKLKHNKHYSTQDKEVLKHAVWSKNKKRIDDHNSHADEFGYTLAMNNFGDLTLEEYASHYLDDQTMEEFKPGLTKAIKEGMAYPSVVDWRKQGIVTAVKDQGRCSASYAFATVGALEGANTIAGSPVTILSEQNIIDCSVPFGNVGCNGGDIIRALKFVISNGGISTEDNYPYVEHQYLCENNSSTIGGRATGMVVLQSGSEAALTAAVATAGPVAVTIAASSYDFMFYEGGIFSGCTNTSLNHSLLVIGYGTYNGREYWLLKNSWGSNWGMNGYAMIAKNKNNQCGIASRAAYPIV